MPETRDAEKQATVDRWMRRPIPTSLLPGEIWNDIPGKIGQAMGGQQFFFEEELTAIHRIGICLGLGWRLPKYRIRHDRINHCVVRINRAGALNFYFLNSTDHPEDGDGEIIALRKNLQYRDLRPNFEEVIHGSRDS